jgi:hypothetical protein
MRTALRHGFFSPRPDFPPPTAGAAPYAAPLPLSLLFVGQRRPPVGRRLGNPPRRVPARSQIVLRAGTLYMR